MNKKILFVVFLFHPLLIFSQVIVPIENHKAVHPKKQIALIKETWPLGLKGIKSTTLECSKGDTVLYTISRARLHEVLLTISDAGTVVISKKFSHKQNILTGSFTAVADGTILVRLRNHSLLGNSCTIDIKKKIPPPLTDTATAKPLPENKEPIVTYCDSIFNVIDTLVYLACSLNLKQPADFYIPVPLDTIAYSITAIRTMDIHFDYRYSLSGKKNVTHKMNQSCFADVHPGKFSGALTIYLQHANTASPFIDSLKQHVSADAALCHTSLAGLPRASGFIFVTNTDKVSGKYVRIQLVKIIQIPCKPVAKHDK
jgi:hypothetical protein